MDLLELEVLDWVLRLVDAEASGCWSGTQFQEDHQARQKLTICMLTICMLIGQAATCSSI